ncbi:hypothetical protein RRG08_049263 [Elysia crispata]|uniref:Uncharacterized protein n=1 Tax=Elysia crispata TaxID=231223 RepID=A0AAE0ZP88_9GAST|nr:hypothetical protein RRG08_049263 [Elysia crispata]
MSYAKNGKKIEQRRKGTSPSLPFVVGRQPNVTHIRGLWRSRRHLLVQFARLNWPKVRTPSCLCYATYFTMPERKGVSPSLEHSDTRNRSVLEDGEFFPIIRIPN